MSSYGAATLEVDVPAMEKPQNGVVGLKHWRYDLMAGLQVAMMGIPSRSVSRWPPVHRLSAV